MIVRGSAAPGQKVRMRGHACTQRIRLPAGHAAGSVWVCAQAAAPHHGVPATAAERSDRHGQPARKAPVCAAGNGGLYRRSCGMAKKEGTAGRKRGCGPCRSGPCASGGARWLGERGKGRAEAVARGRSGPPGRRRGTVSGCTVATRGAADGRVAPGHPFRRRALRPPACLTVPLIGQDRRARPCAAPMSARLVPTCPEPRRPSRR